MNGFLRSRITCMKNIKIFLFYSIFTALALPSFLTAKDTDVTTLQPLTEKDIIALTESGVVRVLHDIKGEMVIEPFDINLKTFDIISAGLEKESFPIDTSFSGTGFIVSPEGHILTNAHVVSLEGMRTQVFLALFEGVLLQKAYDGELTESDIERLQEKLENEDRAATERRGKNGLKFITFKNIQSTITVLNPTTEDTSMEGYRKEGFQATIIGYPKDFEFSNKDIAIIHIDKKDLPALSLAQNASLVKGDNIYTFGFPGSADLSNTDLLSSSFTNGTVSGLKDSLRKDFKIIQTNAKIAQGSSGSPAIDETGNVVGVITYESGDQSLGDNFGFAIPIEIAQNILLDNNVDSQKGEYQIYFSRGIALKNERHCKKAIEAFQYAREYTNPVFFRTDLIDPYIEDCAALIASGKSIDDKWDEIKNNITNISGTVWLIIIGSIFGVIILTGIVIVLVRRMRKEESEIDELENLIVRQKFQNEQKKHDEKPEPSQDSTEYAFARTAPSNEIPAVSVPPDVVQYSAQMRQMGSSIETIRGELRKAGWSEDIIIAATTR